MMQRQSIALQSITLGIVFNQLNQILICKRKDAQHLAGFWEFPGGKLEPDESYKFALRRELAEEIGITVNSVTKFIDTQYDYEDRNLHFQCFKVTSFSGEIQSSENQQIRWVNLNELETIKFPQANRPVVDALTLPQSYMIADEEVFGKQLLSCVKDQLERGVKLIQHRAEYGMSKSLFIGNAQYLKELCDQYNAKLISNCSLDWLADVRSHGIHVSSRNLKELCVNTDNSSFSEVFSASCHNEDEVSMANQLGVRCVLIGPVNQTKSHPEACVLGWKRFNQLCAYSDVPAYALGGMHIDDNKTALTYGAQGIAAIRAFVN